MTPDSRALQPRPNAEMIVWPAVHFLVLMFAVWLVSPLIVITPADYRSGNALGLRLALGLLIFILYTGKWTFDVFSPQGLAGKVSRLRIAALIVFIFVVVSFMIFIVSQAAALYLRESNQQDESGSTEYQAASPESSLSINRLGP